MRVFLAEPTPNMDVSKASRFGELIILLPDKANPKRAELGQQFLDALDFHKFSPEHDAICLSGRIAIIPYLTSIAVWGFGLPIKFVMFDARTDTYFLKDVNEPSNESEEVPS